jgi:predicted transglutaminase-like cysteine proteinase
MKLFFIAVITALLSFATVAQAAEYMALYGRTETPQGWLDFCVRYAPECDTVPLQARDVILDTAHWKQLVDINNSVNQSIIPMTDMDHWGIEDQWDYPNDGKGDCEDYVLLKRWKLLQAGWPRQALLLTRVLDQHGDGHMVLTVRSDRGEFILDNITSYIFEWYQTGYTFDQRQSQTDPNVWILLKQSRGLVGSLR